MTTESPKPSDEAKAGALLPPAMGSTNYNSRQETNEHILRVRELGWSAAQAQRRQPTAPPRAQKKGKNHDDL
jgi:hypothetical protein